MGVQKISRKWFAIYLISLAGIVGGLFGEGYASSDERFLILVKTREVYNERFDKFDEYKDLSWRVVVNRNYPDESEKLENLLEECSNLREEHQRLISSQETANAERDQRNRIIFGGGISLASFLALGHSCFKL